MIKAVRDLVGSKDKIWIEKHVGASMWQLLNNMRQEKYLKVVLLQYLHQRLVLVKL